jgi:hypothetical protein
MHKFFGSRRLRASPSLSALHKFFGSRRLRASPQGYSPWTSVVQIARAPSVRPPPLARSAVSREGDGSAKRTMSVQKPR